ncbi:MAG: response regulator [Bacteroidales bacterium]|nr:response regulator [Bacteroidales bacterium]
MQKILYVDDEIVNLELFKINFRSEYNVYTSLSADEALDIVTNEKIKVIITDFKMPGMDGVDFINQIKKKHPDTVCMMLTGFMSSEKVQEAISEGNVYRCILKPWKKEEVSRIVRNAFSEI